MIPSVVPTISTRTFSFLLWLNLGNAVAAASSASRWPDVARHQMGLFVGGSEEKAASMLDGGGGGGANKSSLSQGDQIVGNGRSWAVAAAEGAKAKSPKETQLLRRNNGKAGGRRRRKRSPVSVENRRGAQMGKEGERRREKIPSTPPPGSIRTTANIYDSMDDDELYERFEAGLPDAIRDLADAGQGREDYYRYLDHYLEEEEEKGNIQQREPPVASRASAAADGLQKESILSVLKKLGETVKDMEGKEIGSNATTTDWGKGTSTTTSSRGLLNRMLGTTGASLVEKVKSEAGLKLQILDILKKCIEEKSESLGLPSKVEEAGKKKGQSETKPATEPTTEKQGSSNSSSSSAASTEGYTGASGFPEAAPKNIYVSRITDTADNSGDGEKGDDCKLDGKELKNGGFRRCPQNGNYACICYCERGLVGRMCAKTGNSNSTEGSGSGDWKMR